MPAVNGPAPWPEPAPPCLSTRRAPSRQKLAWLRSRTRWAVCCAGCLLLAGFLGFHARQQRLAQWIQPQAPSVATADEAWRGRARDRAVTNVTVVTIATTPSHELELLQASCPHALRVLGAGQRYEKYRSKVTLLFDELMCAPLARGPVRGAALAQDAPEQHRSLNAPALGAARGAACAGPPASRHAHGPPPSSAVRAPARHAPAPEQPWPAGGRRDPSSGTLPDRAHEAMTPAADPDPDPDPDPDRAHEEDDVILYVDALDASFFPCGRDLLAEFLAFKADIVFQADDFDWRAPRPVRAGQRAQGLRRHGAAIACMVVVLLWGRGSHA